MKSAHGLNRVVIEEITPQIDAGRHPVCRIVGDEVAVTAVIYADGHDRLAARLLYRHKSERRWHFTPMTAAANDIWTGNFKVDKIGSWSFTVQGWIDHFETWTSDLKKRLAAQSDPAQSPPIQTDPAAVSQEIPLALRCGAILIQQAAQRARGADAQRLRAVAQSLNQSADQEAAFYEYPITAEIQALMARYPDLAHATLFEPTLPVWVDRERARFSSWYELFPRSTSPIPGQHGTFRDVERQLAEIAAMGFDILYLPPIHPIGHTFRKGPNNTTAAAGNSDLSWPGSPWAIGDTSAVEQTPEGILKQGKGGGHTSIHPQLGSFADFDHLVTSVAAHGMEIALDIAFQCSPDHPWITAHPSWFLKRPNGTLQYAENPPKKYQDIYPLNFESSDWRSLWSELYSVFVFWIKRGVHVFRVDNPHTKALPFWQWCLEKLHDRYPDIILLAEAFTTPHLMYALAKGGFTQSYTYFTWRTTRPELESYLEEIVRPPVSDFFQPNFWPNTPDILSKILQQGGRPAFAQRLILAATLTANYGIYGPAFELAEHDAARPQPGQNESEEYLNSEKYQIRQRDRNAPGSLVPLITSLNSIRRANLALQTNRSLHFHPADNPQLLCYSKSTPGFENTILVAVNLDPFHEQAGFIDLDFDLLGIRNHENFRVEDLLTGVEYSWHGRKNFVALRPEVRPAHLFRIVP